MQILLSIILVLSLSGCVAHLATALDVSSLTANIIYISEALVPSDDEDGDADEEPEVVAR